MSSGRKEVEFSTQERALSTDVNRLQKFEAQDMGELFRYMLDAAGNDDLDAGGVVADNVLTTSCEVFNGLLVRLVPAALNLSVDPGVAMVIAPDGDPDASAFKFVRDPGVPGTGALAVTANGAGSARVDVVECQFTSVVVEADSRDVFDPTTGLFTVQAIAKATAGRFTYRVRAGTAGAGFPGVVAGWTPLAVVLAPAGSTTTDAMTFWDVRPLLCDRERAPFALSRNLPLPARSTCLWNPITASLTNYFLSGSHEVALNGRRLGGRFRRGTPGTDAASVDLTDAGNQELGFVPVPGSLVHAYLCAPYGLPRWARYTTTAPRQPSSPRGIVLLSNVAPDERGIATSVIVPPAASGLVVPFEASNCVHVGTAAYGNSGGVGNQFSGFNRLDTACYPLTFAGRKFSDATNNLRVAGTGASASNTKFGLVVGVNFPRNARSIFASFDIGNGIAWTPGSEFGNIYVFEPGSSTLLAASYSVAFHKDGSAFRATVDFEIPFPSPYPGVYGAFQWVEFQYGGTSGTPGTTFLYINGWRF